MSLTRTLNYLKISALLGGVVGLGLGCVIDLNLEPLEDCESGSNNYVNASDECECRIGYEWCNPDDPSDLECCEEQSSTSNDEVGTTTTGDGDTTTTGDGDTTTGDGDTTGTDTTGDGDGDTTGTGELPPEECTADEEGFYWCTHSDAMGPQGSQFFICQNGLWVEDAAFMDETCQFDNYDFAYGCVDDGAEVIFECGVGSGEACNNDDAAYCVDDDQIGYCLWGKETWDSCQVFCTEEGIDGITYEYGECDDSIPDDVACFCCDSGDEGCPI